MSTKQRLSGIWLISMNLLSLFAFTVYFVAQMWLSILQTFYLTLAILQIMAVSTGKAETGPWPLALLPGAVLLLLSIAAAGTIGFGDGLAVCAAGIWCGPEQMLFTLFFALLLVPAAAAVLRLRKKRVMELPFLPFLLAGYVLAEIML